MMAARAMGKVGSIVEVCNSNLAQSVVYFSLQLGSVKTTQVFYSVLWQEWKKLFHTDILRGSSPTLNHIPTDLDH